MENKMGTTKCVGFDGICIGDVVEVFWPSTGEVADTDVVEWFDWNKRGVRMVKLAGRQHPVPATWVRKAQ